MKLSKTAYVVLGMLALGKRTGYDIKQLVDVSTRFFWAASYGQIYPELGRLEEAGLVRGRRAAGDGRRRKEYELTDAGAVALHDWLGDDAPLHTELRHEGLLKFFFADGLEPSERAALLRRMRAQHEEAVDFMRTVVEPKARAAADEKGERQPLATLEFGIAYNEFFAGWCREQERALERSRA